MGLASVIDSEELPLAEQQPKVSGPASYFPSIEKKYGKSIAEWKTLIRGSGITKHMEIVSWLKTQHEMGHGHANALVAHTLTEDKAT